MKIECNGIWYLIRVFEVNLRTCWISRTNLPKQVGNSPNRIRARVVIQLRIRWKLSIFIVTGKTFSLISIKFFFNSNFFSSSTREATLPQKHWFQKSPLYESIFKPIGSESLTRFICRWLGFANNWLSVWLVWCFSSVFNSSFLAKFSSCLKSRKINLNGSNLRLKSNKDDSSEVGFSKSQEETNWGNLANLAAKE